MKNNDFGIFTISLDFELYWGVRDKKSIETYKDNLDGVEAAIEQTLSLFEKYRIHATWATVGFLFAKGESNLKSYFPQRKPNYSDSTLDPYKYIESNRNLEPRYHFAGELVEKILSHEHQEIGSHTFSHYYCDAKGQSTEDFRHDMYSAMKIAQTRNISLKSFVFPRNQCQWDYLPVLRDLGITSYRGNDRSLFRSTAENRAQIPRTRLFRLLDAHINLSGHNTYPLDSIKQQKPYNVKSSRFLRPVSSSSLILSPLKKRRIIASLEHAAKQNEIFHLWWHPHNFGKNIKDNIEYLESVLFDFSQISDQYGMKSLNMSEIVHLADQKQLQQNET